MKLVKFFLLFYKYAGDLPCFVELNFFLRYLEELLFVSHYGVMKCNECYSQ